MAVDPQMEELLCYDTSPLEAFPIDYPHLTSPTPPSCSYLDSPHGSPYSFHEIYPKHQHPTMMAQDYARTTIATEMYGMHFESNSCWLESSYSLPMALDPMEYDSPSHFSSFITNCTPCSQSSLYPDHGNSSNVASISPGFDSYTSSDNGFWHSLIPNLQEIAPFWYENAYASFETSTSFANSGKVPRPIQSKKETHPFASQSYNPVKTLPPTRDLDAGQPPHTFPVEAFTGTKRKAEQRSAFRAFKKQRVDAAKDPAHKRDGATENRFHNISSQGSFDAQHPHTGSLRDVWILIAHFYLSTEDVLKTFPQISREWKELVSKYYKPKKIETGNLCRNERRPLSFLYCKPSTVSFIHSISMSPECVSDSIFFIARLPSRICTQTIKDILESVIRARLAMDTGHIDLSDSDCKRLFPIYSVLNQNRPYLARRIPLPPHSASSSSSQVATETEEYNSEVVTNSRFHPIHVIGNRWPRHLMQDAQFSATHLMAESIIREETEEKGGGPGPAIENAEEGALILFSKMNVPDIRDRAQRFLRSRNDREKVWKRDGKAPDVLSLESIKLDSRDWKGLAGWNITKLHLESCIFSDKVGQPFQDVTFPASLQSLELIHFGDMLNATCAHLMHALIVAPHLTAVAFKSVQRVSLLDALIWACSRNANVRSLELTKCSVSGMHLLDEQEMIRERLHTGREDGRCRSQVYATMTIEMLAVHETCRFSHERTREMIQDTPFQDLPPAWHVTSVKLQSCHLLPSFAITLSSQIGIFFDISYCRILYSLLAHVIRSRNDFYSNFRLRVCSAFDAKTKEETRIVFPNTLLELAPLFPKKKRTGADIN